MKNVLTVCKESKDAFKMMKIIISMRLLDTLVHYLCCLLIKTLHENVYCKVRISISEEYCKLTCV